MRFTDLYLMLLQIYVHLLLFRITFAFPFLGIQGFPRKNDKYIFYSRPGGGCSVAHVLLAAEPKVSRRTETYGHAMTNARDAGPRTDCDACLQSIAESSQLLSTY